MARKKKTRVARARKARAKRVGKKHCKICKRAHKHPAICRLRRMKAKRHHTKVGVGLGW